MSDAPKFRRSFSPASRWKIGSDMVVRTLLVVAVVVMANYLGTLFFKRFYLSSQTRIALSSRTLNILHSLTNQMTVTLYYDTHDQENFYPTLLSLANEYHAANKNISVRTVNYITNPGEAEKVKEAYALPGSAASPNAPPSKDLVIFACGTRHEVVPGEAIVRVQTVPIEKNDPDYDPDQKKLQFRKKPVAFNGEVMFTSKLLTLAHAQPFKAYFLQGDGESSLTDNDDNGYAKFGLALVQNDLTVNNLELSGQTDIPMDCSLLIIAAPVTPLSQPALQKIDTYLQQGGRLLALFNYDEWRRPPTGLEPILQRWGINVIAGYIKDPQYAIGDWAVEIRKFNQKSFVNPLTQLALEMVLPRAIAKVDWANPPANAPQVDELVFSSDTSLLMLANGVPVAPDSHSVVAAVEQKPAVGIANKRGYTRIVVAGDSHFLNNQLIDVAANRDFLNYAANWLLDRQEMLAGISPRPVTEYRLLLTQKERGQLNWLLLGALPGGILIFGWLVWLVRRK